MSRKNTPSKAELAALVKILQRERETIREMQGHAVPPKKHTKLSSKVTPNSFNKSLRGVPGGPFNSSVAIIFGIRKMIDAEETGTVIAGPTIMARLKFSGRHCDTTKSNYLV